MKIRQLMIAMLGVFAMTACTQTDRAQESAESGEVPPSISSAQIAIHGNLKLCDPFASGGAATLNGYYYTVLRPDGNLNIHYLDYATHSDIILCSRPNCTHDDESCSSFIQSNSLVPSLAVVGDRLLIVGGGIGVSDPEEGDLPYIEVMQLDGNDRKRVYQANASSEFGALVCDDQNFYTVERITKIQDDIPILTQHIAQIDLNTGEKTVLSDMGTNIVYLCDATGNSIYYYSIEPQDDSQTYSKTISKYYAYDIENNNTALIDSISSDSKRKITITDGNLYQIDSEAHQVLVKHIGGATDGPIIKEFSIDEEFENYTIRCVIDGKIVVDGQQKSEDGTTQSITHIIDCDTGETKAWPLYYDSAVTSHPAQVEILAMQDDAFLVRCGVETLDVKYGDGGTYTMSNSQYATIKKSDFWYGIENYNYFA